MVKAGQRLHTVRVQRRLSIEEIASATKIKPNFLLAIERGEYGKLPSPAYAQGFICNYAEYLGIPKKEVIALFRREYDSQRSYQVLPDVLTPQPAFVLPKLKIQQSVLAAGVFLFFVLTFLLYQYRAAYIGPSLSLSSPQSAVTTSHDVLVSGSADSDAVVTVNNEPVSVDIDGNFTKKLSLFPGNTTITIKARNRFGKETVIERPIVVKQ